ncbi:MAG: MFS transporter [Proteobacteria bacterium]|nr:MFS transporter [Pseudomonadota bacterium]
MRINRRLLAIFLLGFSSGLPIALTRGTLQAWLSDSNVDLKTIGIFALVGYPYTFKFLWSPFMVRFRFPLLGLRRGWILFCQIVLALLFLAMAYSNPAQNLNFVALIAVAIAFFSASQDIVVDGYRAEVLKKDELGTGAGLTITGYRLAMIYSGAIALIMADHMSWETVYLIMAASMLFGVLYTFLAPEPEIDSPPPKSLKEAVIEPLAEYFSRSFAFEILLFIILYKLGDVMALALQTKFLLTLGFSKSDIGYVAKAFGLASTIAGSLVGGYFLDKLGMKRALIYFGILQGASIISFAYLSEVGLDYTVMSSTIAFENFCSGLGNAGYIAFLMSLCNKKFSTTQYALLTSLGAIAPVFSASTTGFIVEALGWTNFFILCTLIAAPGTLLVMLRFENWRKQTESNSNT